MGSNEFVQDAQGRIEAEHLIFEDLGGSALVAWNRQINRSTKTNAGQVCMCPHIVLRYCPRRRMPTLAGIAR